jgi:hypothetical protein
MHSSGATNALLGKSLRNRALVANALCTIAEEEAHGGDMRRAVETIRAIRGVLGEVTLILEGDTSGISSDVLEDTADLLSGLDGRIASIEHAMVAPRAIV